MVLSVGSTKERTKGVTKGSSTDLGVTVMVVPGVTGVALCVPGVVPI